MGTNRPGRRTQGKASVAGPRPLDVAFILLAVGAVAAASVRAYSGREGASIVRITTPTAEYLFPLDLLETVSVEGPLGNTTLAIDSDGVRVISSPCPHQICVQSGTISRTGQWIGCLPNSVFVRIEGGESGGVDAVSF